MASTVSGTSDIRRPPTRDYRAAHPA